MAQFCHSFGFYLPYPFTGNAINVPDIVQGFRLPVFQSVTHPDNTCFTRAQSLQYLLELLLKQREGDGLGGGYGICIFDKVANSESPSSPSGVCSEIGSRPYF